MVAVDIQSSQALFIHFFRFDFCFEFMLFVGNCFRFSVPKFLPQMREVSGGRCSTEEPHFQPSLEFFYVVQLLSSCSYSILLEASFLKIKVRKFVFSYSIFMYIAILVAEVTSNWLACFPISARKHVYDAFFANGLMTEVVQALVPCLQPIQIDGLDVQAVRSNTER